ncbi:MAG TPA: hypothetical protein VIN60_08375 [Anaerolineales bacterium]
MSPPNSQGISECSFCHTKIIVPQSIGATEREKISKFVELEKTAFHAGNFADAVKYCDAILEINPKDKDAWTDKAVATAWLTTEKEDRFQEAYSYIARLMQLYPDAPSILEAKKKLQDIEVSWCTRMGRENNRRAADAFSYMNSSLGVQCAIAAMNYYFRFAHVLT